MSTLHTLTCCENRSVDTAVRCAQLHVQLTHECQPIGTLETLVVAEIARRGAAMEEAAVARGAAKQLAAAAVAQLNASLEPTSGRKDLTAGLAICHPVEQCERNSLAQGKAFVRGVELLMKLQDRRRKSAPEEVPEVSACSFNDEEGCSQYLASWQRSIFRCRKCGSQECIFFSVSALPSMPQLPLSSRPP
jgi:hypothetical protein